MRVWYFSEMAYHPAWEEGLKRGSLTGGAAERQLRPEGRARAPQPLSRRVRAVRRGRARHHGQRAPQHRRPASPSRCRWRWRSSRARQSGRGCCRSARPIANRPDPVRVAEEMAWLDVLSGGRLEMGLVKGAPYEIAPANSNPANLMRRYWEAHDLILKAMSTTDGPFNWEGEFFHYRNVNIWPRPYQQPTPPVWMTGLERRDRPDGSRARPRGRDFALAVGCRPDVRGLPQTRAGAWLDGRPRPFRLCRGGRCRCDARGGSAPSQPRRRLCAHLAGGGGAVHQPAWLQLDFAPTSRC